MTSHKVKSKNNTSITNREDSKNNNRTNWKEVIKEVKSSNSNPVIKGDNATLLPRLPSQKCGSLKQSLGVNDHMAKRPRRVVGYLY